MQIYLHIGGLAAVGFDSTDEYLLTITHSGRGLFSTKTCRRVARDASLAYPESGTELVLPIDGKQVPVTETSFDNGAVTFTSRDGNITLNCESDGVLMSSEDEAMGIAVFAVIEYEQCGSYWVPRRFDWSSGWACDVLPIAT